MATLCKLPCFLSLSSHKLSLNQHQEQYYLLSWKNHELPPQKCFRIYASSVKNTRGRRKVKSNVELCNDIREFVSAVGLPEGHVPSMKELSDSGRTDLANIVRRRGYKVIRELLSNVTEEGTGGSDVENNLAEEQNVIGDSANTLKDVDQEYDPREQSYIPESSVDFSLKEKSLYPVEQLDDEVKVTAEDGSLSTSLYNMEDHDVRIKDELEDNSLEAVSYGTELEGKEALIAVQDDLSLTEVSVKDEYQESSVIYPDYNNDNDAHIPLETAADFSLEEKSVHKSSSHDRRVNNLSEDISLTTEVSNVENYSVNVESVPGLSISDQNRMPTDSTVNSSLQEKVANFIQNGDLDVTEDNFYGILNENATEESEEFEHTISRTGASLSLNGTMLTPKQLMPSMTVNHTFGNNHLSSEGPSNADKDKDLDVETGKRENPVEINHLKFMLHQKELELSRLKEQIEKEKIALSALQAKAETEISKAQKLISEKDAELHAAEEGLSGLVEVKLQYSGDSEIVEVAGSFNGWHHRIKMDPLPSTSFTDPIGSRKPRLWSTMLWLYPGVYEIKFIVDGHWKIDPQRESAVTKGGICNNILRVNR